MVLVRISVVETAAYEEAAEDLFTPEERESIRVFLAESPEAGDVVPGLAGLRKVRWTEERRRKGKRGGTRVIYLWASSEGIIVLVYAYSKGKKEDLTNAERKALQAAVAGLKEDIRQGEKAGDAARGGTAPRN